jgi:hypothetical protein
VEIAVKKTIGFCVFIFYVYSGDFF